MWAIVTDLITLPQYFIGFHKNFRIPQKLENIVKLPIHSIDIPNYFAGIKSDQTKILGSVNASLGRDLGSAY